MRNSRSNAVYLGIDNSMEIEVTYTVATRRQIKALAKQAKISEAELLADYLGQVNLAALAGCAAYLKAHALSPRRVK